MSDKPKLTAIGQSLGADPTTVKLCVALLEFRAIGISSSSNSVTANTLKAAAFSLRDLLLEPDQPQ